MLLNFKKLLYSVFEKSERVLPQRHTENINLRYAF